MGKKKIILSIALAVYNEENNIKPCLSSVVGFADEIIVVDGGSTDKTVEIAKGFGAKVILTDNPPIFHINKQKALDACHGMWILQLDADEVVTEELRKEIVATIGQKTMSRGQDIGHKTMSRGRKYVTGDNERGTKIQDSRENSLSYADCHMSHEYSGYYIPRRNFFLGHFMRKGGQYPDYVIRLVKRGYAEFPCKSVHEQIKIDGEVGYLKNPLMHYSYRSKAEYWKKANTYITLSAKELKGKNIRISFSTSVEYLFVKPMKTFFSLFIRHKGFMDGYYGFLFALFSALHYPLSWRKYTKGI